MSVFISTSTNAFEEVFEETRQAGASGAANRASGVRRPMRGIEIKENTYTILKILNFRGEELPLVSSSAVNEDGSTTSYSNFIVQGVQEQRVEKQQIVETFGEDFIYFFGERPRFLDISGVLMNTNDFNWKSEFWHNYENYFRGTKLVEQNARLYMFFDDVVVEGYMLQASAQQQSMQPYHLPFSFRLFVTNYAILSQVGATRIPDRGGSGGLAPDVTAASNAKGVGTDGLPASAGALGGGGAAGGGLISFLSAVSGPGGLANTADFSIQSTLENIKNTFFGRQINVPEGVGGQLSLPPIGNQANLGQASRGQQIFLNLDEYPEGPGLAYEPDKAELQRVNDQLALRSGEALEKEARRRLTELGIDVTKRSANSVLLGRGAFAATQVIGMFGMRQADGVLNIL